MSAAARVSAFRRTSFVAAAIPKISAAGGCGAVVCTSSGVLRPRKLSTPDADGYLRQLHRPCPDDMMTPAAAFFSTGRQGNPFRGGSGCCCASDSRFDQIIKAVQEVKALHSAKDLRLDQIVQAVEEIKVTFNTKNAAGDAKTSKSGQENVKDKLSIKEAIFTGDSYFCFAKRYCFYFAAGVGYYTMGLSPGEVSELIQYHHNNTSSNFQLQVHEFRVQKLTTEAKSQKKAVEAEVVRVKAEAAAEAFVKILAALMEASQKKAAALADANQKKALASEEAMKKKTSALEEATLAEKEAIDEAKAAAADADAEYMAAVLASENVWWHLRNPEKSAAKKATQKKLTAEAAYAKRSAAAKEEYAKKIAATDEAYAQKCEAANVQCVDDCVAAVALSMQIIKDAQSTHSRKKEEAVEDAEKKKSQLDQNLAVAIAQALKKLNPEDTQGVLSRLK